jgi:hypothetical protein
MLQRHVGRQFAVTLLSDGRVLVTDDAAANSEIYDQLTDTWTAAAPMGAREYAHQGVLLSDGRVLLVSEELSSEIYDPSTNQWSLTSRPRVPHYDVAVAQLGDGRVLAVSTPCCSTTAEIYNPEDNTWMLTRTLIPRQGPRLVVLDDGSVLVTGGFAEYDPDTGGLFETNTAELFLPLHEKRFERR